MFVTADDGVAAAVVKRFAPRRRYRACPTHREYEARPTADLSFDFKVMLFSD
jgi:hypothetical protein